MRKPKGPCNFKGADSPEYYLGDNVKIVYCDDSITKLLFFTKIYILQICEEVVNLMG